MKETKLLNQKGGIDKKKYYKSPHLKSQTIEISQLLLAGSVEKTVNKDGMKEQWIEEEVTETFTWEW